MDVWEEAKAQAALMTNAELKRGFRKACEQYGAATAACEWDTARFALHCCDATLDVWLGRHPL